MNCVTPRHFISLLFLALPLAGCLPVNLSFSPQQAAIRALTQQQSPNTIIDQASIQIRQTVTQDQKAFVFVSYAQVEGIRRDKCTMMFQLEQSGSGFWQPSSSGGGCSGTLAGGIPQPEPPVEIGSGRSSGSDPTDPGYSHVSGLVTQADIVKIRVTWLDEQEQEITVINGSFLAVRPGSLDFRKIEGLNGAGEVVFSNEPQVAPGK